MVSTWSSPESPFYRKSTGFLAGAPFSGKKPDYSASKVSPLSAAKLPTTDFSKIPFPVVGIDFETGKRGVDLQAQTGPSIPKPETGLQSWLDIYKAMSPIKMAEMEQAAQLSSRLTQEQLSTLYPYLSAAGAESTARNLAASQAFLGFKEQMPSNIQAIMASKQAQATSAASSEAQRQMATAAQLEAAKRFAGSYSGQYISYA